MFQMDESAFQVPQESGADVWQNGRTGEMSHFAVFKVNHERGAFGRIRYKMENEGVGIAQHPFTGQMERYTFVLSPPLGSVPKSDDPEDNNPTRRAKPQAEFWHNLGFVIALGGGLLFWMAIIAWFLRLVCR